MDYTLISFGADPQGTTYYSEAADGLRDRCDELGISHFIEVLDGDGEWLKNTRLKGPFVRATLEKLAGPVLWVDVDCPVHRVPDLSGYEDCDFAAVEFLAKSNLKPPLKIMGTTLFFNFTDGGRRLAREWEAQCVRTDNPDAGDHRMLSELFIESAWLNSRFLPDCYSQHRHTRGSEKPVISLGLAREVESRRSAIVELHRKGKA